MKKIYLSLLAFIAFALLTATAGAQTSYGTVAGSVTDPTGAAVPQASVTITSRETGETHVAITKGNGGYEIQSVGSGNYRVVSTATSFEKTVIDSVQVLPSITTSINPVLKIGSATDTIEVSGANQVLQTESGEVSETITAGEISQLPINSLNPYSLVTTLPGVTTVTVGSTGNGGAYSVNGSRPRSNNYLIEGQDNNDAGLTGQGLQPQNDEAIDSATFLLNGYSAEFGYAGGGVSNIVFKSGTNHFHGSAFDRLLNSSLNAISHNNRLNGIYTKTKFREDIYGGTLGGFIIKDKVFAFGAYQQDHYRSSSLLSILTVPTVNGYATLNAQAAAFPRINTLIKAYGGLVGATAASGQYAAYSKTVALGLNPITGVDRGTVEYGGVQRTVASNTNASELDLKGDWLVNPMQDKLQFRYIRTYSIVPYDIGNFPSQLPLFDTNQGGPAHNAGIVYTHVFSPNLINEARASWGRISYVFDLRPDTYANPLAVGPTITIAGVTGYGIPTNVPQGRSHNTYQLQDAVSYTRGPHTIKVGFDVSQIRVKDNVPFIFYGSENYQTSPALGATPAYSGLANYIDDYSGYTTSTGQSATKYFGSPIARPYLTQQNYYLQDHWKVSPRLALDYGLRYEYFGDPFDYVSNPATNLNDPYGSFSARVQQQPQYTNLGPRVGFAYQPYSDGKTVIRGAFGMFYDHLFTNITDNIQASAPNAATPIVYGSRAVSARGTPNWSQAFATLNPVPTPLNTQTTIASNFKAGLTYQYNLTLEQEFPGAFTFTLGYAGSRGEHLYSLDPLNPVIAATGIRANPARGVITAFTNDGDSYYHGLQAELSKRYRHNLQFRIAYTFAKATDDVSDPYSSGNLSAYAEVQATLPTGGASRRRDYGLSAYDHRQRLAATIVYNTPVFHPQGVVKGILAHIANNYTISAIPTAQSGSVYNVQVGYDVNNDGITNDRPVLTNAAAPLNSFSVPAGPFYGGAAGTYCDGSYYQNAKPGDNYCHVVAYNQLHFFFGNLNTQNNTIGRNAGITPGINNVDTALQRAFKVGENQALSFRAESFNVLNHANTGVPNFTLYGTSLLPIAPGYSRGTFANFASTGTGNRTLRFFLRYSF